MSRTRSGRNGYKSRETRRKHRKIKALEIRELRKFSGVFWSLADGCFDEKCFFSAFFLMALYVVVLERFCTFAKQRRINAQTKIENYCGLAKAGRSFKI